MVLRSLNISASDLLNKINFVSEDELLVREIKEYITDAGEEKNK